MKTLVTDTHVKAPPEAVFATITDLHNAPGRIKGIRKLDVLTPGPVGMGTKFRETRVMFGKEATETMEIVGWDPGRGYAVRANSCGCIYNSSLRCEPESGGTRLTMTFDATPTSFGAKVMSGLMGWMMTGTMRKMVAADLADIKAHTEAVRAG